MRCSARTRFLPTLDYEREFSGYTALSRSGTSRSTEWKAEYPFAYKDTEDAIQPQYAIELLCKMTKGEAIITTGVGQHQMWAGAVL